MPTSLHPSHLRRPLLLAAAFVVLAVAPGPGAAETSSKLQDVAHSYSLGVGDVRCASRAQWDADFASSVGWAYTNMRHEYAVLGPTVCEGAFNVGTANVPL
jgi:hypothetical protein